MSLEQETKMQYSCTFCYKICVSYPVSVKQDILIFLKILSENIDKSALQKILLCEACLGNMKAASEFKTSLENLRTAIACVEIKQEIGCDMFVTCYTCKNSVKQNSTVLLRNIANSLIPDKDLEVLDDPRICKTCQMSMLNLQSILELLDSRCGSKSNGHCVPVKHKYENIETVNIKYEVLSENITNMSNEINKVTNNQIEAPIKEEVKKHQGEVDNQEFQIKQEELDLKMDCDEEQPSEERVNVNAKKLSTVDDEAKKFQCQICAYKTQRKYDLRKHLLVHKDINEIKLFKCQICNYQTKYKSCMDRHMLIHKDVNEVQMFKCQTCEFRTKHKSYLKAHMLIHKDIEREIFECNLCTFQSPRKGYIKQHMLTHTDNNETEIFRCHSCEYHTKHKSLLKRHTLIHKNINEKDVFKCHLCAFHTFYKNYMTTHMLIHKNINETKVFKCQNCNYKTKYKRCINRHMLIHKNANEIQMFKCQICEFQTKHKTAIVRHGLVHKDISEVEIFRCNHCEFQTKYKRNLKKHEQIHKNVNEIENI